MLVTLKLFSTVFDLEKNEKLKISVYLLKKNLMKTIDYNKKLKIKLRALKKVSCEKDNAIFKKLGLIKHIPKKVEEYEGEIKNRDKINKKENARIQEHIEKIKIEVEKLNLKQISKVDDSTAKVAKVDKIQQIYFIKLLQ